MILECDSVRDCACCTNNKDTSFVVKHLVSASNETREVQCTAATRSRPLPLTLKHSGEAGTILESFREWQASSSSNRGQLRFNIISVSARSRGEKLQVDESETGAGPTRKLRFAADLRIRLY